MSEAKSEVKNDKGSVDSKLDESIGRLADMAKTKPSGAEAMQFSQAALNLAHTKSILKNTEFQVVEFQKINGSDAKPVDPKAK